MVAPLVAAAGISAVGSVVGGLTGGKGAKKAAKIQAETSRQQIAAAEANRNFQYGLNQPAINQGNAANDRISALLNLGGDTAAAEAGYDAYRESSGYQHRLNEGYDSINTNAYARGLGNSGATMKALLNYGQNAASAEFDKYLGQLGNVANMGANARGLVAGIGQNTVTATNDARQTSADASGNAALVQANARNQAMQNLFKIGSQAMGGGFASMGTGIGSSYGTASAYGTPPISPVNYAMGGLRG